MLVSEARKIDLIVSIYSANHQQLLVDLWTLGESVESAQTWVRRWHDELRCTTRCPLRECRRFDVDETAFLLKEIGDISFNART